jgi:hypothetical protein
MYVREFTISKIVNILSIDTGRTVFSMGHTFHTPALSGVATEKAP